MGTSFSGFESPTDNPFCQLAFEGCQRLIVTETKKKEPMTTEILKELFSVYGNPSSSLIDKRFLITCLLGFAGFFRISELLEVKMKHIRIMDSHMEITVSKSKTDQHREGHIVFISRINSITCPVAFLEIYLNEAKIDIVKDAECYLICRMFKVKKGHKVSKTLGISYTTTSEIFRENISKLKISTNLSLHSLRSGGASAAAANGVSDRLISKQGRWSSEKGRNGYIKDTVKTRLGVSSSLGL